MREWAYTWVYGNNNMLDTKTFNSALFIRKKYEDKMQIISFINSASYYN